MQPRLPAVRDDRGLQGGNALLRDHSMLESIRLPAEIRRATPRQKAYAVPAAPFALNARVSRDDKHGEDGQGDTDGNNRQQQAGHGVPGV